MKTFVELNEAKEHLRIDHDFMDADIILKVQAAHARVLHHLNGVEVDKLGETESALIKAAVLNVLGYLDRVRAEEIAETQDRFWLPPSAHSLLIPLRNLGIA